MLFTLISIFSSSVSVSDSSTTVLSLCTSSVIVYVHAQICYFIFQSRHLEVLPRPSLRRLNSCGESVNRSLEGGQCNQNSCLNHPGNKSL
ncbi:hypothetical protein H5410_040650 [Solanum commersonii]|uniref:Secreted protein n=1 Tax=Solanum commersonii TaxID=4109 RepID=A0A9J5XSL5_SOLCO|nr:hypothetical protein H5410_040650 [Solanum commersonii]